MKEKDNGIKIFSKVNNIKIIQEPKENDHIEQGEGELMQAMFDDTEAMNECVIEENL